MSGEKQGPDMYFAGGECLDRFGVLVRRTDVDLEEATQETEVRNSVAKMIGRGSIVAEAKTDIARVEWVSEVNLDPTRNVLFTTDLADLSAWSVINGATVERVGGSLTQVEVTDPEVTVQSRIEITEGGLTGTNTRTLSFFLKKDRTAPTFQATLFGGQGGIIVDPADGSFQTTGVPDSVDVVDQGGWLFVTLTVTDGAATNPVRFFPAQGQPGDFTPDVAATGSARIREVMVDEGSTATPFQQTPRDFDRTVPSLFLEDARTNGWTFSEELDNAAWTKVLASIQADFFTAPDGTFTADKLTEDTSTAAHQLRRDIVGLSNDVDTSLSFYALRSGRNEIRVVFVGLDGVGSTLWYDLVTGETGTATNGARGSMVQLPGPWFRCTFTAPNGNGVSPARADFNLGSGGETEVYTGDGTSGVALWGLQVEENQGSASSYIKTGGATATRAADLFLTPFPHQLQPLSVYSKFLDDGTGLASAGLWLIGGVSGPTLFVLHTSTGYQFIHRAANLVDSFSTSGNPTTPANGALVETLAVLFSDGSVRMTEVFRGETFVGPLSGPNALVSTFGLSNVSINSRDIIVGSATGFSRFLALKIQRGVRSLDFMRAL